MSKKLRWGFLQPLTGGAYFAAENVFGYPAEYILSYPGLEAIKYVKHKDENGNEYQTVHSMGNERHLLEYLKARNRLPNYLQFNNQGMLDYEGYHSENISIIPNNEYFVKKNICLNDMDLIASVPICAGLSAANTADHGKEDSVKNNNMKFLLEYTLKVIKPKVYIFENAPGLYTNKGLKVREYLNKVAEENHYSVTYVKTDTNLHHNIQSRARTFAIFWQWIGNKQIPPPEIGYENAPIKSIAEYMSMIPKNATQNEVIDEPLLTNPEFKFLKKKFGKKWRDVVRCRIKSYILHNKLQDEFYEFHKDEKLKAHYDYCVGKKAIGLGYYDRSYFPLYDNKMPTVYHGNTWSAVHPTEDRLLSMRELSHLMGMPHDWEYLHTWNSFCSIIGQNVPVKTFEFWINECKKVLENWEVNRLKFPNKEFKFGSNSKQMNKPSNVFFHNNVNPKLSDYG